ncbi:MAG TPA: hypothetical protein VGE04_19380 [Chloroflexia bacterium]|jgi:hypothetical protein
MTSINPHTLSLSRLKRDIPALTEPVGGAFVEACMVCLEDQGHQSGTELEVTGTYSTTVSVQWEGKTTVQMQRTWKDMEFATEIAACGIAILLIEELTDYTVFEAASRGEGIDYWLADKEKANADFYTRAARLEVSGVLRGSRGRIAARVQQKIKQTESSAGEFPVYVVVVEFSRPEARMVKT